jgi:predicted AAA+ superfamily ATPase
MYYRTLIFPENYSFFLFGPRATGKSTLLKERFEKKYQENEYLWIDLLVPEVERELSLYPSRIIEKVDSFKGGLKFVIIDEIQKVPALLDLVHKLIFEKKINFALTGSSARKLKRGKANLLAGRAFSYNLHPLTFEELGKDFKLEDALHFGTLPDIYKFNTSDKKNKYLSSYAQTYIKEEILVEQLVRNIQPFRSFLEVAAQCNGEIINYSKIAREAQINPKSVERYFEILEDTLLGHFLRPYSKSIRKRQLQSPKFFLFDMGVTRELAGLLESKLVPKTYAYGKAFEHFIFLEAHRLNDYREKGFNFYYLKTKDGLEIDLILEKGKETILIEIKSKKNIIQDDLKALKTLGKEFKSAQSYVLCQQDGAREVEGIRIINWVDGLKEIFN